MRYFGKEGAQCRPGWRKENEGLDKAPSKCRQMARAVLFGRVPKAVVLSLGLGALAFMLALALICGTAFKQESPSLVRDMKSAVSVKR
jgi:hypothetical protein